MKSFTNWFLILTLFTIHCFGQTTFQKIYSVNGHAVGLSGALTTDGGYIIGGSTYNFAVGNTNVYLTKTNSNGDMLWSKSYGSVNDDFAYSVAQTYDGGYILVGSTFNNGNEYDVYLLKTDSLGNLLWSKKYGNSGFDDYGYFVQQTLDGGYIITGQTENTNPCCNAAFLIKTDSSGNVLWIKSYRGNEQHHLGNVILQTNDSGYVFVGSYGGGLSKIWLVKTDTSGNKIWSKTFGWGEGHSVEQTSDKGYIITGIRTYPNYALVLVKTDSLGNLQWNKYYQRISFMGWGYSVKQTPDNGYIFTGKTCFISNGDIILFKTDANGDTLWTRVYGGPADDTGNSVQLTSDGGYAIIGCSDNFGVGNRNAYIIKTDSTGNSGCNSLNYVFNVDTLILTDTIPYTVVTPLTWTVITPTVMVDSGGTTTSLCFSVGISGALTERNIKNIFPNPTIGHFTITFSNFVNKGAVQIYDSFGKKVFEDTICSATKKEFNLKDLSSGIYIVRVYDGERQYNKKLIIE